MHGATEDGIGFCRRSQCLHDQGRLAEVLNSRKIRIAYHYAADGALAKANDQFGSEIDVPQAVRVAASSDRAAAPSPDDVLLLPDIAQEFDDKGRLKRETSGGQSTSYGYDQAGRIASIAAPQGRTAIQYDAFGRLVSIQLPDRRTTRIEYNGLDLPTKVTTTTGEPAEELRYNENGMLTRRSRSSTDWEEFSYDQAGRLAVLRRPPAMEERYSYDDVDRMAAISYSDGRKVSLGYDAVGRLVSETWSSGEKSNWHYDANGRLVEFIDAAGLKTIYAYDDRGSLVATEDPVHAGRFINAHRRKKRPSSTRRSANQRSK